MSRLYDLAKRGLDVVGAGATLLATAPILAAAALGVRVTMGAPVLFRQERTGRDGTTFRLAKLRSMRTGPGSDAERLGRFGRFLRESSIDELPTLWHVLRGDMSLVGPRPLLPEYLGRYTPSQARRHEVKPGVTGWAQVQVRNGVGWDEKLAHDVWYVEHRSFWLDLTILARTVGVVLARTGISQPGTVTSVEFLGTTPGSGVADPPDSLPRKLRIVD